MKISTKESPHWVKVQLTKNDHDIYQFTDNWGNVADEQSEKDVLWNIGSPANSLHVYLRTNINILTHYIKF